MPIAQHLRLVIARPTARRRRLRCGQTHGAVLAGPFHQHALYDERVTNRHVVLLVDLVSQLVLHGLAQTRLAHRIAVRGHQPDHDFAKRRLLVHWLEIADIITRLEAGHLFKRIEDSPRKMRSWWFDQHRARLTLPRVMVFLNRQSTRH